MASTVSPAENASGARARGNRGAVRGLTLGFVLSIIPVFAVLALISAVPAVAAPDAERLKAGEDLLITYCGSCHAVSRTGDSPRKDAPAFRVLGKRYPIDSLEESLGEGMMSGHPDMPEISFEADDVGAIVDYLKSIQVR